MEDNFTINDSNLQRLYNKATEYGFNDSYDNLKTYLSDSEENRRKFYDKLSSFGFKEDYDKYSEFISAPAPRVDVSDVVEKPSYEEWYKTVPADRADTANYDLRRAYELLPQEQMEKWRTASPEALGKNHLPSVAYNKQTDEYEFLKGKDHPTIQKELDWYNSDDPEAVEFRKNYRLDDSGDRYRYVRNVEEQGQNGFLDKVNDFIKRNNIEEKRRLIYEKYNIPRELNEVNYASVAQRINDIDRERERISSRQDMLLDTDIEPSWLARDNKRIAELDQERNALADYADAYGRSDDKRDFDRRVSGIWNAVDTENTAEKAWENAGLLTRDAQEKANADIWGGYTGGREARIMASGQAANANMVARLKYHDLQRMADDAWNMLGTDKQEALTDGMYEILKGYYPDADESVLHDEAYNMARSQSDQRMFDVAVEHNAPKNAADLFFRKAVGMNSITKIMEALARSSAGTTGDWEAREAAEQQAAKGWGKVAELGGTVAGIAFDPLIILSGAAGKGAVAVGEGIIGRLGLAARTPLASRLITGSLASSANLGTYMAGSEALDQLRWGGKRNIDEETGRYKVGDYSVGDIFKAGGRGAILGLGTGIMGAGIGNVSDNLVRATESTAGKLAFRTGELAAGTVAEGTVFALPDFISIYNQYGNAIAALSDENSPEYIADDEERKAKMDELFAQRKGAMMDAWTESMAMMAAFKMQSAGKRILSLSASPESMEGFETRLRKMLDGNEGMALTKDEKEELEKYGYTDLKELAEGKKEFDRWSKDRGREKNESSKTELVDSRTEPTGIVHNHEVSGGNVPYNRFTQLISDKNISEAARAKMYYYLTGNMLPMSTVIGRNVVENTDANGNVTGYTVQSIGENGVVTSRTFKTEKAANAELSRIDRQVELNTIDVGERFQDNEGATKRMNEVVNEIAKNRGLDPDYLVRLLNNENLNAEQKQQAEQLKQLIGEMYKELGNKYSSKEIRDGIFKKYFVNVDRALAKEPNRRSKMEQQALEEYANELFKDEIKRASEARRKYEESKIEVKRLNATAQDVAKDLVNEDNPETLKEVGRGMRDARSELAKKIGNDKMAELETMDEDALAAVYNAADADMKALIKNWMLSRGTDTYMEGMEQRSMETVGGLKERIVSWFDPSLESMTEQRRKLEENGTVTIVDKDGEPCIVMSKRGRLWVVKDMMGDSMFVDVSNISNEREMPLDEFVLAQSAPEIGRLDGLAETFNGTNFAVGQVADINDNGVGKRVIVLGIDGSNVIYTDNFKQTETGIDYPQESVRTVTKEEFRDLIEAQRDLTDIPVSAMNLGERFNVEFMGQKAVAEVTDIDKYGRRVVRVTDQGGNEIVDGINDYSDEDWQALREAAAEQEASIPEPTAELPSEQKEEKPDEGATENIGNQGNISPVSSISTVEETENLGENPQTTPEQNAMPMRKVKRQVNVDGKKKTVEVEEEDYLAVPAERSFQYLYEEMAAQGLTEQDANDIVANNLKEAEKALDEAKKKTPTATGSAAARIAEKQRIEAGIMEAQGVVDYWNTVKAMHDKAVAETPSETVVPEAETTDLEIVNSYSLSDEVDENGRQFVLNKNGELAFGNIGEETGLTPAPILLSEGVITNPATNDGYGLVHIEARHGDQIRKAGYASVLDFVEEVAKNYEIIKEGKDRDGNQTYLLQLTDKHNNTLVVELSGDGNYWNINTAGIFKTSYGRNNKEVYNRHTTAKQPAETVEVSQDAEQGDTQTSSSMNTPTLSEGKDNTISENVKGNDQENLPPTEETPVEPTPPTEPVSPSQMSDEVKQQTEQTPTAERTDFVKKATSISGVTRFEETDKGLKVGDKQTWYEFDFADYDGHPEQLASDKQELEFLRGRHEENEYLSKLNPKSKEGYKYAEEHGLDPKRHKPSWWQGRLNSMIANAKKELKKEALLDVVTSYFDQRAAGLQGLQNNSAPVRAKSLDERKKTTLEDPKRKILKKIGEPRTAEEAILLDIANGTRFKWGKPATSTEDGERGLGEYWRWSPGELQSRKNLIDEDNGITPEKYSEAIETGEYFDQETNSLFAGVSDIEGFVSDIITRVHSADDALDQLVQARQALIDSEIEREQEMAKANQDMEAQAQGFEDWDDYKTYQESLSDVQVSNEDYYEISAKFAEQYQEEYERQQRARESESETDSGVDQPDEQQGVHGEGEGGDNLLQAEQAPDAGTNQRPGQSENSPASNPSDGASPRADGEGAAEVRAEIDKLKAQRANIVKQRNDIQQRYEQASGLFGDTQADENDLFRGQNFLSPELAQATIDGYNRKIKKIDDEIKRLESSLERAKEVTQTEIGEGEIESSTPKPRTTAKIGNQKIDDVGEKIGGARKDLAQKLSGKINLEAGTFPKMFPKFDLKKLVEQGLDPKLASTVQFLRQAAQEEYKSKLKRRTKENALAGAKFFAAYAKQVLENADTNVDFTDSGWAFTNYGKAFVITNIALYDKIHEMMGDDMFDIDLTGYEIQPVNVDGKLNYTAYRRTENGEEEKFTPYYEAKAKGGTTFFKKDELDKAIDYMLGKIEKGVSYAKTHPYKISVYYNKDGYFVGVNIGGRVIPLTEKKGRDETLSYFNEHNAELQAEAARVDQQRKEEKKTERPVAKIEQIYADKSQGFRGGYVFAVKLGKEYARIMDQVFPLKDIYKYLSKHKDELQEKAQQMLDQYLDDVEKSKGWKPQLNLGGGRTRVGEDYRKGRDIGADEFRDAFGFRGVEFGNYVTQKERQRFINEAYDALMDLADLIGVSPKALSLGGQLGFAIGARGGGGKNAAHYEPELNVINLTKTQGAGSLAHEWWHALDYYFNREGDKRKKSATAVTEAGDFSEGVRKEMRNAFLDLMERINGSEYYERSKALERKLHPGTIGTGYFDKPTELGARAFQDYVMRRLTDRGQVNDFLSSFTPEEQWNGEAKNYPYPTGKDADAIDERFDKLFGAMEQREENGNVILYHKGENDVELTKEEVELRDQVVGFMKDFLGEDSVITDWEEGQRVLDEANGDVKAMAVMKNIENGIEALRKIAEGAESVPNAMKRDDLSQYGGDNQITFLFGDIGNPDKDFKKGYGLSHIGAKHGGADTILRVLGVIANGKIDRYVSSNKTVVLTDGEYEAVLALTRFGNKETWLFNGWRKDEKTDADGEVSTHSDATQANPTFSREDLGAVLSDAKIQSFIENATKKSEKIKSHNVYHSSGADKTHFFRTPSGDAYGFTLDGKIYIDPRIATSETPIHEYMHLWIDGVERANPKGWNDIKEKLLGEKKTLNLIKSLYPDIKDENDLLKEVFSKYSGKKGAERMRADQKRLIDEADGMVGASRVAAIFQRIREALKKFWSLARDLFAGKNVNLKDKSLDDIADMAMNDFVNRFDPRTVKGEKGNSVVTAEQDAAYMDAVNRGDMETAQRMVNEAAKMAMPNTKVVDENGNPLVVYHGGKGKIIVFDKNRIGENLDYGTMGAGFYFTSDRENAENYARNAKGEGEPSVERVFINIRNIKEVNWNELDGESKKKSEAFTAKAIAKGYDGLTAYAPNRAWWYVAFDPNQIKSADPVTYDDEGNVIPLSERFDKNKNDIRYSRIAEDKQLSLFLQNNSDEYETQDGEKIEFTSLKDYGGEVQAGEDGGTSDGGTRPDALQRKGDTQSPTAYRLRKLEKGETCHVERRYTEFKQFDFTGSEKIESVDDVAYIFKKLEDEAIENSFIVLVKDGKPTIIHTGIGSYTKTIVNANTAMVAYKNINPDKVYFVHNHPSGSLTCSRQDIAVYNNLKALFGDKLEPGIIIDLTSGQYGTFTDTENVSRDMPSNVEGEIPLKTYSFSKQVFEPEWNPSEAFKVKEPKDVASFISSQRLGKHKKMGLLVVNNQNQVVGNIFLPYTSISEVPQGIDFANEVAYYVNQMGGTAAVVFGNYKLSSLDTRKVISSLKDGLSKQQLTLLDFVHVGEGYGSAAMEGYLVSEEREPYNNVASDSGVSDEEPKVEPVSDEELNSYDAGKPTSMEMLANTFVGLSNKNKEDVQKRLDAVKAINKSLGKLMLDMRNKRNNPTMEELPKYAEEKLEKGIDKVGKAQLKYDKSTVDQIVRLSRIMLGSDLFHGMSNYEVKRLLSMVKNATGKNDITKQAKAVVDLMLDHSVKECSSLLDKMLSVKADKIDANGVKVQGKLDANGQRVMGTLKDALKGIDDGTLSETGLDERISEARDLVGGDNKMLADNAALDLQALQMAQQYLVGVKNTKQYEYDLKQELKKAKDALKAGAITRQEYKEMENEVADSLMQNKSEMVTSYIDLINRLGGDLRDFMGRAKAFREAKIARANEIQHNANSDLEGIDMREHHKKDVDYSKRFGLFQTLVSPLQTFEQMLGWIGGNDVNGRGYLYDRFMPQFHEASDAEWRNWKKSKETLDGKAMEVLGKDKAAWGDLFALERSLPNINVDFYDGKEKRPHALSQGNALYVYMANKQTDGRMKLRAMGITEEDVENIAKQIDKRLIDLADWYQGEYMPSRYNDWNEVYERLFGAPMTNNENYFPLKINLDSLPKKEDAGTADYSDEKIASTITGNIIERKKNTAALDLLNADAIEIMQDHIRDMEHWAAFAEFNEDLSSLLSYKRFRNKLKSVNSVRFGSEGKKRDAWDNFKVVAAIASGAYRPRTTTAEKAIVDFQNNVSTAKIAFRINTALKQLLSYPAYLANTDPITLLAHLGTADIDFKWALENLPGFEKRWLGRTAGDTRLRDIESGHGRWAHFFNEAAKYGMTPNAFVDAVTVAAGSAAVYETKKKQYLKDGYSEKKANKKALNDATSAYNSTQQSSENAYVSQIQLDKTFVASTLSRFRNASMGYTRQYFSEIDRLGKQLFKKGYKDESLEFMKKKAMRDGLTEEQAEQAAKRAWNRHYWKGAFSVLLFGHGLQLLWNMGSKMWYYLFGDDDEKKKAMFKEDAFKALFGQIEGLAGGNTISTLASNLQQGRGLQVSTYNLLSSPMVADIQKMARDFDTDWVAGVQDLLGLIASAETGLDFNGSTDAAVAIMDACNGDLDTAKEVALCMMRIAEVPQSTVDQFYIDEVGLTAKEARELSTEDLARRYAAYKMRKNTPITEWMYSDEKKQKVLDKYAKRFYRLIEERIGNMDEEGIEAIMDGEDVKLKKIASKKVADELGGKSSIFNNPSSNWKPKTKESHEAYQKLCNLADFSEDVIIKAEYDKAVAAGNDERAKSIKKLMDDVNRIKRGDFVAKSSVFSEMSDRYEDHWLGEEGGKNDEGIMEFIRAYRKNGMKELGIR